MYLVSYLRGLVTKTPTAAEGLGVLLKCVGIGYITAFGASVCSDMGEKGLADKGYFCRQDTCSRYGLAPRDFVH